MSEALPGHARCLDCGYRLRGLAQPKCPECGRSFDPADPDTYDARTDEQRRRRRTKRIVGVVVALALLAAFVPLGIMTSTVTLTCPDCTVIYRTARYELKPPSWFSGSYPHLYLPLTRPEEEPHSSCPNHRYDIVVTLQSRGVGQGRGTLRAAAGKTCFVNDEPARPDNGPRIIEAMLRDSGVSLRCISGTTAGGG